MKCLMILLTACLALGTCGAACADTQSTADKNPVLVARDAQYWDAWNCAGAANQLTGRDKTADFKKFLDKKGYALLTHQAALFATLQTAAMKGTKEEWDMVVKYVKDDAVYSCRDDRGRTLLFMVGDVCDCSLPYKYSKDGPEIAKFLVGEKKLDVNARAKDESTPLFGCADPKLIDYLISKGADIEAKDRRGYTPLMSACGWKDGDKAAVALIEHGADPSVEAPNGYTALFEAAASGQSESIPALLKALVGRLPDSEHTSTRYVVDTPMNVPKKDWNGWTPLCVAVYYNNLESAKALIKCGANVDFRKPPRWQSTWQLNGFERDGSTPIFEASAAMAKLLIESGADVNAVDAHGLPPLYTASGPPGTNSDKVEVLLAAGANPFPDARKPTPYQQALKKGNQAVIAVFRKYHADVVNPNCK